MINLLVFLCGALSTIDLPLGMRVSAGEALAFVLGPILWIRAPVKVKSGPSQGLIVILASFVISVFISDIVNTTDITDSLRGILKPIVIAMHGVFFLAVLARAPDCLRWYFYGRVPAAMINYISPSTFAQNLVHGSEYTLIAFGLAPVVSSVGTALAVWLYPSRIYATSLTLIATSGVLVLIGAPRSAVLALALPGIIVGYLSIKTRNGRRVIPRRQMLVTAFVMAITIFGLYKTYTFAASRGLLSELQNERYEDQFGRSADGETLLSILANGRTEVYAAMLAIAEKPLTGHGSWSGLEMNDYFYAAVASLSVDSGMLNRRTQAGEIGAAGHSVFFTAWMENGILAALSLIGLAYITFRVTQESISNMNRELVIILLCAVHLGWDWLFSPFNMNDRVYFGLICAVYLVGSRAASATKNGGVNSILASRKRMHAIKPI